MPTVHPTAVVETGATLAEGVVVGPFCHVGAKVTLGPGTELVSHVSIAGRTSMGAGNKVYPHAALGHPPQDLKYRGEDSGLVIGDHNVIRENVTMHLGTANDRGETAVGDHNLIMAGAHIGHDAVIGSHVILANTVQLAGHVAIEDYAAVGGASAIHHFVTVGQHAYVGGMTRVVADVPPFMFVEGHPARVRGINQVGLRRRGFGREDEAALREAWRRLFKPIHEEGRPSHTSREARTLLRNHPDRWVIRALVEAVTSAGEGVYGRHRELARRDSRYADPHSDAADD